LKGGRSPLAPKNAVFGVEKTRRGPFLRLLVEVSPNMRIPDTLTGDGDSADAAVLFSGGIDSAILLAQLLDAGRPVTPIYVRTGCIWQESELRAARRYLAAIARPKLANLVELEMPLADVYANHWSMTGRGVPDWQSPNEAVFLPGRNPLLLIKPILWCQSHGVDALAIATLAANPFDDATPSFFARFAKLIGEATGQPAQILRPFENLSKAAAMQLGRSLPLELTFSCLSPMDGVHCGRCNKCAERHAAFGHLASGDPTRYSATRLAGVRS
jgi:7-cyano-7-deazaguanine synthase